MENYILKLTFLILYFVRPVSSTRELPPFNNRTYVYRISSKIADLVHMFDETTLDSLVQCGVFCVSSSICLSAFYATEERMCMVSNDVVDNYFMSPSYQASVEDFGSILYIDLEGWVGSLVLYHIFSFTNQLHPLQYFAIFIQLWSLYKIIIANFKMRF